MRVGVGPIGRFRAEIDAKRLSDGADADARVDWGAVDVGLAA